MFKLSKMEMYERIKQRMSELNLKSADIVSRTGLTKGTISQWVNGQTSPRGDNLMKLCRVLSCSPEWIKFGVGRPSGSLAASDENHSQYAVEPSPEWTTAKVKLMDQAFSAGHGAESEHCEDFVAGIEEIPAAKLARRNVQPGNARIIKIRGDSMYPTIWDGDEVLADTSYRRPESGEMFAFEFDGRLLVKRFTKRIDGSWLISSDNKDDPSLQDEVVSAHNAQLLRIIGKVKGIHNRDF